MLTSLVAKNRYFLDLNYEPYKATLMAMKVRIISDDFTSATDGLCSFAQLGWHTAVAFHHEQFADTQVVSTDTDSRTMPEASAAARVAAWATAWKHADILVKQFDSTLRGPVAHEVAGAWTASGKPKLLVIPAFPAAGRTTVNAQVLVDGVPVSQTAFARDPLNPVCQSDVIALFAQAGITLVHAKNADQAVCALESCSAVMMDASTEEHMLSIVQMAWARTDILWAGSTGLLRALSQAVPNHQRPATATHLGARQAALVVGSHNPQSRAQLAHAKKELPQLQIFATPEQAGDPHQVTLHLVEQVVRCIKNGQCDSLIVTGGETAKLIAQALQSTGIRVLQEVQPGIPLCLLQTPHGDFPLITKAGGFGNQRVFLHCVAALNNTRAVQ
jgi:D-threonate/D-erythronate kinase